MGRRSPQITGEPTARERRIRGALTPWSNAAIGPMRLHSSLPSGTALRAIRANPTWPITYQSATMSAPEPHSMRSSWVVEKRAPRWLVVVPLGTDVAVGWEADVAGADASSEPSVGAVLDDARHAAIRTGSCGAIG